MSDYLLALDQGTSSSRSIVFDRAGRVVAMAQTEFPQIYPEPGWVEHDPQVLWQTQLATARQALKQANLSAKDIRAVGITNQRETTVVWNRKTGAPVYNAIVWQDRRAEAACVALRERGLTDTVLQKTGLRIDAYFSGTKLQWILDNVPGVRAQAERGELAFGTVDSWLIWKLTAGAVHATDFSNAARTMLFNIHTRRWDSELLAAMNIPDSLMPQALPSSADFGQLDAEWLGAPLTIGGVAGDQQSALFGQACFSAGMAKNTYGTGCFMLMHTGEQFQISGNGLITTAAAQPPGPPQYALEGSVFIGGAVIQWLRDGLNAIKSSSEVQALAESVPDTGGVVLVAARYARQPDRPHAGHDRGPHRARRAGEHRIPEHRAAGRHEPRRGGRRWHGGERTAGGWRRLRERFVDAVPGRSAGHPGGSAGCHRDHRPGRRLLGGSAHGAVQRPGRAGAAVARRAHLRASHDARTGSRTTGSLGAGGAPDRRALTLVMPEWPAWPHVCTRPRGTMSP
jgi:sugar (pentulose or hexulose) kinase